MGDFKLSAVLAGHESDVRAVIHPDPRFAVTASRDGTTRVWRGNSASPPSYDATVSSHGASFKTCLAYIPPRKGFAEGLILAGGQDAVIEARQPDRTAEDNYDGRMVGHGMQVCSLDVDPAGVWIVSGSWDSTARIWNIISGEAELELEGHTAAVWAVVAYSSDLIITGCADQAIRIFDRRGKMMNSFHGKDIVRALAKLPTGHDSGGELVSASNDGIIRIWTLKGTELAQLVGDGAFIYSLTILPSGEIISSGEDRSVRIWKGTSAVQVITLPAISVWSVSACPNGDIITGSSDKIARIFTRDKNRFADPTVIAEFEESVRSSAIPEQQLGDINRTDMPGPEFLTQKSGTKEGQIQMIKEADGTVYAYTWSQNTWQKVGTVLSSATNSGNKKMHEGKEYDYVFDIDIADGKPPLKLPYNSTEDPHQAASKFLAEHELPVSYLEETANFIVKNTQGATLGQTQVENTGPDPWGTESRYRPDGASYQSSYQPPASATKSKLLPYKDYLSIVGGKPAAGHGQILKLNKQYADSGDESSTLSQPELDALALLLKQLERYNFDGPASLPDSPTVQAALRVAVKVATRWQPPSNRLAGLDLLRFVAAAVEEFPHLEIDGLDFVETIGTSGIFDPEVLCSTPKLAMVAIRAYSNLIYASEVGRGLVEAHYRLVTEKVKLVSSMAASDQLLAIAVTTFYLNLAVYITFEEHKDQGESPDRALTIIEELVRILSSITLPDQQASEPMYRGMVALGTVLAAIHSEELKLAAKEIFDVPALLKQLEKRGLMKETRFQVVVADTKKALV